MRSLPPEKLIERRERPPPMRTTRIRHRPRSAASRQSGPCTTHDRRRRSGQSVRSRAPAARVLLRPRQRILRSLVGVSYPFVLHDLTARIVFSVCVYGWALAEVVLQLRNRRGRRRQRGWTSWPTVASIWIAVGLAMRELRQGRRYRGVLRPTPCAASCCVQPSPTSTAYRSSFSGSTGLHEGLREACAADRNLAQPKVCAACVSR